MLFCSIGSFIVCSCTGSNALGHGTLQTSSFLLVFLPLHDNGTRVLEVSSVTLLGSSTFTGELDSPVVALRFLSDHGNAETKESSTICGFLEDVAESVHGGALSRRKDYLQKPNFWRQSETRTSTLAAETWCVFEWFFPIAKRTEQSCYK